MKKWKIGIFFALVQITASLSAQVVVDDSFYFPISSPSFNEGEGPNVCIDGAHFNYHTIDGSYKPFADLIRGDGYTVKGVNKRFTKHSLKNCNLLVIANAVAKRNREDWSYPHNSAFTRKEILALVEWIRKGGNLLLIADHPPWAGAASGLGAVIGIIMADAYSLGNLEDDDLFSTSDETLHTHDIVLGRSADESIDTIITFTGQAIQTTHMWDPLISFGNQAVAIINPAQTYPGAESEYLPGFSVAGWTHAAARKLEDGRIVFLGEAAMCTAQLSGPDLYPFGMNYPLADQNAQFCLNTVRWLTRVIDNSTVIDRQYPERLETPSVERLQDSKFRENIFREGF